MSLAGYQQPSLDWQWRSGIEGGADATLRINRDHNGLRVQPVESGHFEQHHAT